MTTRRSRNSPDRWRGTGHGSPTPGRGRYRLTDPFTEVSLGTVDAQHNTVKLTFEQFQIIVAELIS